MLVRADVDQEHWLSAGVAPVLNVLVRGSDVYTPVRLSDGFNVARFQGPDDLLASGYIWDENRRQLAYKPFVVSESFGAGEVVAFYPRSDGSSLSRWFKCHADERDFSRFGACATGTVALYKMVIGEKEAKSVGRAQCRYPLS